MTPAEAEAEPEPGAEPEPTPGPEATSEPEPGAEPGMSSARVRIWPFAVYEAVWVTYAALLAWQLSSLPDGTATYDSVLYRPALFAGVALTALGPVVSLVTWLLARRNAVVRKGLFASALLYGAVATLVGVVLWWAALIGTDYLRLGRVL